MEPRNFIQQNETEQAPQHAPIKKRYQKPELIYLAPLEAMASICEPPEGKSGAGCYTIQS
jgi:hypothetical protein